MRILWSPGTGHPRVLADLPMPGNKIPDEMSAQVLANGWVRVFWDDGEVTLHPPTSIHMLTGTESGPERDLWVWEFSG